MFILCLLCGISFAGTTGKIAGRVTVDGDPLPGAVVIIMGTNLGANTNEQGHYSIDNVPVGTYTVQTKMMGFRHATQYRVRSVLDSTTNVDFEFGVSYASSDIRTLKTTSDKLLHTSITPHIEAVIEPNTNLIYCCTFQLAWTGLQSKIIKAPILLETNPTDAAKLNKHSFTGKDIDPDCYVAIAGQLTEALLQQINDSLQVKFGTDAPLKVDEPIDQFMKTFFSYSYLYRDLRFPEKYDKKIDHPILFQTNATYHDVKAFGIPSYDKGSMRALGKQLRILYYNSDDDFALQLMTKTPKDELILAKITPQLTLAKTIQKVNDAIDMDNYTSLMDKDILEIPYLDFDIEHNFTQFLNKHLLNRGWTEYFISKAFQKIHFQMNESGVILKSESRVRAIGGIDKNTRQPRKFVFDKPYLIELRKKGSRNPYFAMWVANPELLVEY